MARRSNGDGHNNLGNLAIAPLSGSSGPFTVACWLRPASLALASTYVFQGLQNNPGDPQWAVIFGFVASQVEFFLIGGSGGAPRTGSGITLPSAGWHHVCYRKAASGASAWDKFLDGAKTQISASISFTVPVLDRFFALAAGQNGISVGQAPFTGSVAEILVDTTAWTDAAVARLAAGQPARSAASSPPAFLWELRGVASPEPEATGNRDKALGFSGVLGRDEAPVSYPRRSRVAMLARGAGLAGGTGAASGGSLLPHSWRQSFGAPGGGGTTRKWRHRG